MKSEPPESRESSPEEYTVDFEVGWGKAPTMRNSYVVELRRSAEGFRVSAGTLTAFYKHQQGLPTGADLAREFVEWALEQAYATTRVIHRVERKAMEGQ